MINKSKIIKIKFNPIQHLNVFYKNWWDFFHRIEKIFIENPIAVIVF